MASLLRYSLRTEADESGGEEGGSWGVAHTVIAVFLKRISR
jgi:hypothetical protein